MPRQYRTTTARRANQSLQHLLQRGHDAGWTQPMQTDERRELQADWRETKRAAKAHDEHRAKHECERRDDGGAAQCCAHYETQGEPLRHEAIGQTSLNSDSNNGRDEMTEKEWRELLASEDAHDQYLRECDNANDVDYLEKWS